MLEREVSSASSHASGGEDDQNGEEQAAPVVSTDKPARVMFPDDLTVMQVDCGTFHTGESELTLGPLLQILGWLSES